VKIFIATMLIMVSVAWFLGMIALYSDSLMTADHAELYSGICFVMILGAIYLFYSHNKNKDSLPK
jgi:hypothetical protein